jgi:hypothetical protein
MITEYNRDQRNPSAAIQVGVTYMWLGEWQLAWDHFREVIERGSKTTDIFPKFAGTAKWCAGHRECAIQHWELGLGAGYTDASGGITIPLHLYFAAAACPTLLCITDMGSLIRRSVQANVGAGYPRLLGRVALGELSVADALREAKESDPNGIREHPWKIAYWEGVHQLASGNEQGFLKEVAFVANLDWETFDRCPASFIRRLWSSEFFLARHHWQVCAAQKVDPDQ